MLVIVEKLLYASDFPVSKGKANLVNLYQLKLTADGLDKILYKNAQLLLSE